MLPLEYIKVHVPSNKEKMNLFVQFHRIEMLRDFPYYHTYLLLFFCLLARRLKLFPGCLSFSIAEGYLPIEKDNVKRAEALTSYTPKPSALIVMPIDFDDFSKLSTHHIYIKDYEFWAPFRF